MVSSLRIFYLNSLGVTPDKLQNESKSNPYGARGIRESSEKPLRWDIRRIFMVIQSPGEHIF